MATDRKTQRARILALLVDARGEWVVPLARILELRIGQLGARILELRRLGEFVIENKTAQVDGQRHSWYRLVRSFYPAEAATLLQPSVQGDQGALFGSLNPGARYPD